VTLPYERLAEVDLDSELRPRFYERYEQIYGHAHHHLDLEITTCRLTASGPRPQVKLPEAEVNSGPVQQAIKEQRQAYGAGHTFAGPAIVEERDSTAVIGPEATVSVDRFANLIVHLQG
jgi:N-methylhydantoinase A